MRRPLRRQCQALREHQGLDSPFPNRGSTHKQTSTDSSLRGAANIPLAYYLPGDQPLNARGAQRHFPAPRQSGSCSGLAGAGHGSSSQSAGKPGPEIMVCGGSSEQARGHGLSASLKTNAEG